MNVDAVLIESDASGVTAEVAGTPSPAVFRPALTDLGVRARRAVMIGDDAGTGMGGARAPGRAAVLARAPVAPDRVLGSSADLPALPEGGA